MSIAYLLPYLAILFVFVIRHHMKRKKREADHAAELEQARAMGLTEPPSLHPVVDPARCMGSGSCTRACPEQALGIVNGKAVLTHAAACIGHGACRMACPVEAIKLVFGTERRGVDIPDVRPNFETNVAGIFIAGELGGMGLIRKAAEQGRQAMESIRKRQASAHADFDVIIVGAGPAGISAGLSALEHGLRYKVIEQEDSLGGTVYHYPRNKIAMTAPVKLPIIGTIKLGEIQKEALLTFWNDVVRKTGLQLSFREHLEGIERDDKGMLRVRTSIGSHTAGSVLLAIGRRGSPRKLGVPGEESGKVVYRVVDAEQYRGRRVLVVGGGDSALEAAIALAQQPGAEITLSYRGDSFSRVKAANRSRLEELESGGRVRVMLGSQVVAIHPDSIILQGPEDVAQIGNDAVIVCAGGVLPTALLREAGIGFETKFGAP